MARKKSSQPIRDWFPDPLPALIRARKRAEDEARRTNTTLVEAKGEKPIWVRPKPRASKTAKSPSR